MQKNFFYSWKPQVLLSKILIFHIKHNLSQVFLGLCKIFSTTKASSYYRMMRTVIKYSQNCYFLQRIKLLKKKHHYSIRVPIHLQVVLNQSNFFFVLQKLLENIPCKQENRTTTKLTRRSTWCSEIESHFRLSVLIYLSAHLHPEHIKCLIMKVNNSNGLDGSQPYCADHFRMLRNAECSILEINIIGVCQLYFNKKGQQLTFKLTQDYEFQSFYKSFTERKCVCVFMNVHDNNLQMCPTQI